MSSIDLKNGCLSATDVIIGQADKEKRTAHYFSLLSLAKFYYNQECPFRVDNGVPKAQGKDERAAYSM